MKKFFRIAVACALFASLASAQTSIQQQLVVSQNGGHNGQPFKVDVQLKGSNLSGANTMNSSTIDVTYELAKLSFPTTAGGIIGATAWNAGIDPSAYSRASSNPGTGFVRVIVAGTNVNGNANGTPAGFDITTSYQTVVTLTFTILDETKSATLGIAGGSNAFAFYTTENNGDNSNTSVNVTGTNLTSTGIGNAPLPIQLATFAQTAASQKAVTLSWSTLSETNNYGFEVQRSAAKTSGFATISGSFTKGNGTSAAKHTYAYTDAAPSSAQPYYRLRQIDLDNSEHFSDALQVTGAGFGTVIPTEFAMRQNYPNPFNPTTVIEFDLPKDSHVSLEMYNILGQRVMTILDEVRLAGSQRVQVDASRLATGVYLYRLVAGDKVFMKKMTLIK
jgi:hypothetical protein